MPKTLLLADDSVVIQKLVGLSFANEDVKIVTANNGDDAIARALDSKPDVVIADVIMPGKSGYEVCEAIKASPTISHIPVLLLTGTFEAFDEERARAVGSVGHITKPFEAQALVARVNALFKAPRAATPPPIPTADLEITEEAADTSDAFDFFEDDVSDLASVAPTPVPAASVRAPADPLSANSKSTFPATSSVPSDLDVADLDAGMLGSDSTVALMPDDDAGDSATELPADLVDLDSTLGDDAQPGNLRADFLNEADDAMTWADDGLDAGPAETVVAEFSSGPAPHLSDRSDLSDITPTLDASDSLETLSAMDMSDEFQFGSSESADAADAARTHLADELFNEPTSPSARSDLDRQLGSTSTDELSLDPNEDLLLLDDSNGADLSMDPGGSAFDISPSDLGDLSLASSDALMDDFDVPPAIETLVSEPIADRSFESAGSSYSSSMDDVLGASAVAPLGDEQGFSDDEFLNTDAFGGAGFAHQPARDSAASDAFFADDEPEVAASEGTFHRDAPPAAPAPRARAATGGAVAMTPVLQQQLHETLEKVAWEAFSEISEQVVKQVLERVESIAWEVIPQMAEALVREEIRKMKGEDTSGE